MDFVKNTLNKVMSILGFVTTKEVEEEELSEAEKQNIVDEINATHREMEILGTTLEQDILDLTQRYDALRKPYYKRRNKHIKQIPSFWITCFSNHPDVQYYLGDYEEIACLHYLTDLEVDDLEDGKSGYQIKFHFSENPYFENEVLVKKLVSCDETDLSEVKPTVIQWKEGKDLIAKLQKKQEPTRGLKRRSFFKRNTFFTWFASDATLPDFIANSIKEDIWVDPVKYYRGNFSDDEYEDSDDDMEEEEDVSIDAEDKEEEMELDSEDDTTSEAQ